MQQGTTTWRLDDRNWTCRTVFLNFFLVVYNVCLCVCLCVSGRLVMETKVYCSPGSYGASCGVTCDPQNDATSGYDCDPYTGRKVCLGGESMTSVSHSRLYSPFSYWWGLGPTIKSTDYPGSYECLRCVWLWVFVSYESHWWWWWWWWW
jgi:hypothetical protein